MAVKAKLVHTNPKFEAILQSLNELILEQNYPHNIRSTAIEAAQVFLNGNGSIAQRKNVALQLLEEMISNTNLDVCIRTTILNTMTLVESLSEEKI